MNHDPNNGGTSCRGTLRVTWCDVCCSWHYEVWWAFLEAGDGKASAAMQYRDGMVPNNEWQERSWMRIANELTNEALLLHVEREKGVVRLPTSPH